MQELIPLKEKNSQYEPDEEEIIEYAQYLGFQLPEDNALLWIAKQGLKADLPNDWEAFTNKEKELLFMNTKTGAVQEEHPLDDFYRDKYRVEKKKLEIMERVTQENTLLKINEESESEHTKTVTALEDRDKQKEEEIDSIASPKKMTSSDFISKQPLQTALMKSQYMSPQGLVTQQSEPEEMDLIEEYNVKLADIYNTKIKVELEKIDLPKVDVPKISSKELKEVESEVATLSTELKEKKKILEEIRRERIKKEKELVDMEVQFEMKKQRIVEAYRKRLKKKLEEEKKKKKKELTDQFEKTLESKKQSLLGYTN